MTAICPRCGRIVGIGTNGIEYPHKRYVDGAGPAPDQDHTMIECDGEAA